MDFMSFAAAQGLIIDRLESGRIRRCATKEHTRKKNGAYLYAGDWGWVQSWESMTEPAYWRDESIVDPVEIERQKARIESSRIMHATERARERANAARKAQAIRNEAKPAEHTYLDSKGFKGALGLVVERDEARLLVIPMTIAGKMVGCQLIDEAGEKKFLRGQRTNNAEFIFGSSGVDVWCEGWATAKSIHACLSALKVPCMVHACFSAGNLQRMARTGFVVADCDASQTGEKAAQATGLPYWMPEQVGTDFNDYHAAVGTFAAGMELRKWLQKAKRARH